jgi:hypothetical protein
VFYNINNFAKQLEGERKSMKKQKKRKATDGEYEAYKQYLQGLNLSCAEYEKKLREWCVKNGY